MNQLFVALQHLLPHHWLCRIVYGLTRVRVVWVKNLLIDLFVAAFRPDMADAAEPSPRRYETFNAFFTRALRTGARPIDPDPRRVVSPCDGTVSIADTLNVNRMLQAKGHDYTLESLLAAPGRIADTLRDGLYATIYLAPYNYHRLHMPAHGRLQAAWYVPGRLYSVNRRTVERVPGLFARNERLILVFDGEHHPFVLVLVGALFVGSMSTVWHGEVTPWRRSRPGTATSIPIPLQPAAEQDAWLARGAEFARFNMGSTIVMLSPPGALVWDRSLQSGSSIRVGQPLGSTVAPVASLP